MSLHTLTDKVRRVTDLVRKYGECIQDDPQQRETILDLRGAARVAMQVTGQSIQFTILARGAEIRTNSWRGQFGTPEIVRGSERDIERIARNADKMSARVEQERAAGAPAPR